MARSKKQERNLAFDHTANDDGVCSKCGLEMIHVGDSQCVIATEQEEDTDAA